MSSIGRIHKSLWVTFRYAILAVPHYSNFLTMAVMVSKIIRNENFQGYLLYACNVSGVAVAIVFK